MDNYIHEENLALFKKRLAEPHGEAQHATLVKLLADEEAKDRLPKKDREAGSARNRRIAGSTPPRL